jgi:hypothetical protein
VEDLDASPVADLEHRQTPFLASLFHLLATATTYFVDMVQKTIMFFGVLRHTSTSTDTSCSHIIYLVGGVLNGVLMDFLERKFAIRRLGMQFAAQFAAQIVVSNVVSSCMLEVAWEIL